MWTYQNEGKLLEGEELLGKGRWYIQGIRCHIMDFILWPLVVASLERAVQGILDRLGRQ